MALNMPTSPLGKQDLRTPHLPPLLHSHSGNELYERPQTPPQHAFTSPIHTPQGSPSKNRLPPGATDLPNVFDNAMRLTPSTPSPTKSAFGQPSFSPGKIQNPDDWAPYTENVVYKDSSAPDSPTRRSNKENAPLAGGLRINKEIGTNLSHAAVSRQEPYRNRERVDPTTARKPPTQMRGLTAEELEKLQLPNVKRLANVTQLC